jgi:hypothetical protein
MPPAILDAEGDSLFVVVGPELQIIRASTGEFDGTRTLPTGFLHSILVREGRVFFRYVNPETRSTVGVLSLADTSTRLGGPFPDILGQSPIIAQGLSELIATPTEGDTVLVAIRISDFIYIGPLEGPFDSIRVATLGRQGSRPDLVERIAADPENAGPDVYAPSLPMHVDRLSSGELLYVVSDLELIDRRFTGKLYVSVVDPRNRATCPDALVPVAADPRPVSTIRGDTLMVLSQELRGTDSEVWVRKYLISTAGCEWASGSP